MKRYLVLLALALPSTVYPQIIPGSPFTPGASSVDKIRVLNASYTAVPTTGTVEEIIASYPLPANTLDSNDKALRVTCYGSTAANANTKVGRIRFGGIGGATAASVTTASSGAFWRMQVDFFRTAAAVEGANGFSVAGTSALSSGNAYTLNTAATIDIVCTGTTATAIGDMTKTGFTVELVSQ